MPSCKSEMMSCLLCFMHNENALHDSIVDLERDFVFLFYLDYTTGFGGKFGVQTDRQDKVQISFYGIWFRVFFYFDNN